MNDFVLETTYMFECGSFHQDRNSIAYSTKKLTPRAKGERVKGWGRGDDGVEGGGWERGVFQMPPLPKCPRGTTVCVRTIALFSFSDTRLRARTFVRNVGGGGHNSTVGVTLPEVWARSVQCVARGKPFKVFWPWAWIRQTPWFPQHPIFKENPLVSATSPTGLGFLHPLFPVFLLREMFGGFGVSASPIPGFYRARGVHLEHDSQAGPSALQAQTVQTTCNKIDTINPRARQ